MTRSNKMQLPEKGLMTSFHSFRKYFTALFLVIFSASVAPAAAEYPGRPTDTVAQPAEPTYDPTTEAGITINDEYFRGFAPDLRSQITAPARGDMPAGSVKEYLKDYFRGKTNDALHRGGQESRWSLAPSPDRLSLNPLTNIRNLVMILQYRF